MTAKQLIRTSTSPDSSLMPVCVDLDHTLVQTDTLAEQLFHILKAKPWHLLLLPLYALAGKAKLKAKLASIAPLNPVHLPYNKDVFFYLKRMSKRGHAIYLVTGANQRIAENVAQYLGIFSGVMASTESVNLIGEAKAKRLLETFGEKKFSYMGDSRVDLAVWKHAATGIVVSSSQSLASEAKKLTEVEKIIPVKANRIKPIIKAMRIHQWVKNVLIFLPLLMAHDVSDAELLRDAVLAFFSFSFMASAIYVINDLSDLEADRQHDDKKKRPFASGALPLSYGFILVPLMLTGSVIFAASLHASFWAILAAYIVTTNLYTFYLKRIPMADIVILSCLYSIRLLAGSIVTGITISPWLMAFTGFLFISLAMIKRCSELLMLKNKGASETVGRGYGVVDIPVMVGFGSASGYGAILVLALYINSEMAGANYPSKQVLWFMCPLMTYWISRMWFLANRGKIHSDPVKFAITDRISWLVGAVAAALWYIASYYHI